MRLHPRLLQHALIIILCVFQALCFPIPMQSESAVGVSVDVTSNKEVLEVLVQIPEVQYKPVIRKNSQVMSKLAPATQTKPVFLVLALFLLLRIPTTGLSFKPWYCLFKRRLFLLPIKFTSMYLSLTPMAPKYACAR
ncbi:hypothetical protein HUB98_25445 [Paenibacillus barcinonensis]|uniref:Uncharacterized protein n=1 Tax=Paenibacillus barcinonensis TaxID=198119 RepID=A0A2V4WAW9_PAEBA|nr:hypothetical protein [Paenibacillus barcinonensis]PYE52641.1 hypothetical protein DFQ00_101580 [Paenibacillus barcinonensis]QKS59213.1 hypothetical protein HUB98_25445 [Paenibacillus barcinonensis]